MPVGAGDVELLGDLGQLGDAHVLQRRELDRRRFVGRRRGGAAFGRLVALLGLVLLRRSLRYPDSVLLSVSTDRPVLRRSLPRPAGRPFRSCRPVPSGSSRVRCATACRSSSRQDVRRRDAALQPPGGLAIRRRGPGAASRRGAAPAAGAAGAAGPPRWRRRRRSTPRRPPRSSAARLGARPARSRSRAGRRGTAVHRPGPPAALDGDPVEVGQPGLARRRARARHPGAAAAR